MIRLPQAGSLEPLVAPAGTETELGPTLTGPPDGQEKGTLEVPSAGTPASD
jgi:hypothetical protein